MNSREPFRYEPRFITVAAADRLLQILWEELDWKSYRIAMFGREIEQPRLTAWCSDPGIEYRYSGIRLQPAPWHPDLDACRQRLANELGLAFNSVLANAYRDGGDAMGWHADDEPELGEEPCIASLSLGETRRMLVRPKAGGASRRLDLEHGSLLIMQGHSQSDWLHSIPRTNRRVGLRINLTFRRIEVFDPKGQSR